MPAPLPRPLLCRARSFAALSLLSFFVLALFPSVRAQGYPVGGSYPGGGSSGYPGGSSGGSYGSPTSSGGQLTLQNGDGSTNPTPYALNNGQYGADYYATANSGQTATAKASGAISYTSTWDGGSGSVPPPPAVIKTETCTVNYTSAFGTSSDSNPLAAGGATPPSPPGSAWTCTRYSSLNSPPASISDSLAGATASSGATAPAGYYATASAGVFYSVSFAPVTMNLAGTTPDSSGNLNILVGQGCTASLVGIPSELLNNTAHPPTYSWTVSGTRFQDWGPTSSLSPNASYGQ